MPRGGHNIKPQAEKKLNGTYNATRDKGRKEADVLPVSEIPCPEHFDAEHRQKWKSVCALLKKNDMLFELDTDALTLYVENWIIARHAWNDIQEKGMTLYVELKHGKKPVTNPAFRQYQDAMKIVTPLHDKFGLNLRSRMGLKVTPKEAIKEDPFEAFKKAIKGDA